MPISVPDRLRFVVGDADVLTFGEILLGGGVFILMASEALYFTYLHQYDQRSGDTSTGELSCVN